MHIRYSLVLLVLCRKDVELANMQNKLEDGLSANGQLQKKVKELLARVQVSLKFPPAMLFLVL